MNIYFKTLLLTVFVFILGAIFGIWIDNYRLAEVRTVISQIDVSSNDARLLNLYFGRLGLLGGENCQLALDQNLIYNNKIYEEGLGIERAIEANKFTPELENEKQRYVLLQVQFWFNSIDLKAKCKFDYSNVVHLYEEKDISNEETAENELQSSILLELKQKCGNKIMLIPLETDLNLTVVDTITKQYNITKYPAIIINEETIFQGVTPLADLENAVGC